MAGFVVMLVAVGFVTGLTTVLFGFGGGFVTVPAVYAAVGGSAGGVDAMHVAVATSTAIMVVNASSATVASARQGRLRSEYLWPIVAFIALGAALGAVAANWAPEKLLRILFVVYIAATLIDSIVRKGFLGTRDGTQDEKPLPAATSTFGGIGIGAVAGVLGVGGSVITVPLLRRRGVAMADATAMANPMSVPVAVTATVVYAIANPEMSQAGQIGYVSVVAAAALLAGSVPTIALTKRVLAGCMSDRVHAIAYLVLLAVVLIAMLVT
ncbi:sulfite exporter TauE/SafE family protein [Mycobacterium bourgelatii]|uniref:sulfite exporter TauE/SafE family protein n=1 Tax=Mycobacterium bourgelatii TaxID=1273442 RepID=UPI001F08660D|nr:sulfite exporter TauE/SafE family protein [Mycobacterium bourgelatii]